MRYITLLLISVISAMCFTTDIMAVTNPATTTTQLTDDLDINQYSLLNVKGIMEIRNAAEYPSIQAAIDSLPVGGGLVYIPAGTYTITTPITLRSNLILMGAGIDATTIQNNGTGSVLTANIVGEVLIKDMTVQGNTSSDHGILGTQFTNSAIVNVKSRSNGSPATGACGIRLVNSWDFTINNSTCSLNGFYGIRITGETNNISITDCNLYNNSTGGIAIEGGRSVNINGCAIETHVYGLYVYAPTDVGYALPGAVSVSNCYFETSSIYEILADGNGASRVTGLRIRDNYFFCTYPNQKAIVADRINGCNIEGNVFDGTTYKYTAAIEVGPNNQDVHVENNRSNANNLVSIYDTNNYDMGTTYPAGAKIFRRMVNNSGTTLDVGNVVILDKTDPTGRKVTTTTTGKNPSVFGMAAESILPGAEGKIQIEGPTRALKVNGTTDIVVGDFITTSTIAGIGIKPGGTDYVGTRFAIALEAYTIDDSNGVIDAYIITPR